MARFTNRNETGVAFLRHWVDQNEAIERLAAYEDSELTPERVGAYATADREGRYIVLKDRERKGVERLWTIAAADAENRLLVLPCRFGETVWRVIKTDRRRGARASGGFVYSVTWSPLTWNNVRNVIECFGKTVFLTRAEAQAAMEQMKMEDKE